MFMCYRNTATDATLTLFGAKSVLIVLMKSNLERYDERGEVSVWGSIELLPVYPCRVCHENRPMRVIEWPHGMDASSIELLQCCVCNTTGVYETRHRLKLKSSIERAFRESTAISPTLGKSSDTPER